MSFSPQMLRRNITRRPRAYNRAVGGGAFPGLLGTRSSTPRGKGVCISTFKISKCFNGLLFRLARRGPSHRNLRADLDHAPGRNVEEFGGVARRFGQANE